MNLIITWAMSLLLFFIVFYTARKLQPVQAADQTTGAKAPLSKRISGFLATFDYLSWALLIAAVCFLIAAIAQTIGTFS